jgi:hypothetical protein
MEGIARVVVISACTVSAFETSNPSATRPLGTAFMSWSSAGASSRLAIGHAQHAPYHTPARRKLYKTGKTVCSAGFSDGIPGAKCPFTTLTQSQGAKQLQFAFGSGIEVGAFLLVFGPLLLPVALLANLRLAAIFALVFLSVYLHIPTYVKYGALGVVGNLVLSLRFLQASVASHLAFLVHPVTLALSFPPALLLLLFTDDSKQKGSEGDSQDGMPKSDTALIFAKGQIDQILADVSAMTQATRAEIHELSLIRDSAALRAEAAASDIRARFESNDFKIIHHMTSKINDMTQSRISDAKTWVSGQIFEGKKKSATIFSRCRDCRFGADFDFEHDLLICFTSC